MTARAPDPSAAITAVLLAGGRGSRMGGIALQLRVPLAPDAEVVP